MAQREAITNAELRNRMNGSSFYWGISAPVGWGCANRPLDVMLVQYLLLRAYDDTIFPTKKTITCDGIFGQQTYKWIKHFQGTLFWLNADGRIDAAGGDKRHSSKTNAPYTIHELNYFLADMNPFIFSDITMDRDLPAALCNELLKVVVDDDVIAV